MIENAVLETKGQKLKPELQSEAMSGANHEWFLYTQMIMPILINSQEAWQLYMENRPDLQNFTSPDDSVGASSIRTSVIAQAVDAVHAQQHLTNFPDQENFFEGKPLNDIAKTNVKLAEAYIAQEMRKVNFLMKVFQDRKNLLLDGTSAVACPFQRKSKKKAKYAWPKIFGIELPIGKPRKTYVPSVQAEGTDYLPLRLEDWRVDPSVDEWDRTPFLYKYYMDVDAVKQIDGYQNTDDVTPYYQSWDQSESLKLQKLEYNDIQAFMAVGEDKDGIGEHKALIMERWGDFHLGGKVYENHVLVWANESVFLYFGPNPYDHGEKPFIISQYNPVPNSLYGKSSIKDAIPEAHALDDLNNTVLDILHNCALPYATYINSDSTLEAYIDNEDVPLSPGKMIPVQTHDSLRERSFPLPNIPWIGDWAKTLREDIRESTGGVPYATGGMTQDQDTRTLGEVQILANGTSTRFMTLIGFYELAKLTPYVQMFFENARQFMSEAVYISDFEKVLAPETLKLMEMEFEVTGSRSVIDKQKTQQGKLAFSQNILPLLMQNGYAVTNGEVLEVNVAEMAKDMAVDAGFQNVDDTFKIVSSQQEISQTPDNPMAAQQASQNMQQPVFGSGVNGPQPVQGPGVGQQAGNLDAA